MDWAADCILPDGQPGRIEYSGPVPIQTGAGRQAPAGGPENSEIPKMSPRISLRRFIHSPFRPALVRRWFAACLALALAASVSASENAQRSPVSYIPLDPPFVVNFLPDSDVRFLQVTIELTTRNPEVEALIRHNSPAIRNNLVFLFSGQDPMALATREGKDKLRREALDAAQQVITEEGGPAEIEAVYFTSFVMQ
jgi:flagellar FliL protein